MKSSKMTRREFLTNTTTGAASDLAILGGKAVRTVAWLKWPVWNSDAEQPMLEVLRSGDWFRLRGTKVDEFEKAYASLISAKRVLATASGTAALETALAVLDVDAGDEVIVSPYTFIATYNVVFNQKALPVFADTDQETFTIDPLKIEEKISERTKAILPVHIFGLPADMDRIMAIAERHHLAVIEDACQAWLAEYRGKMCGTIGDLGCFSFQNSKNIPAGEGGAVAGNDETLMDRCHSYHNCGRPYGKTASDFAGYPFLGGNKRMMEFQAVILLSQMQRAKKDAEKRLENALYLDSRLKEIPGIISYKLTEGATKSAYHIYPLRYKKECFDGLPREKFLAALQAEGIPCSSGYEAQYKDGVMEEVLSSRGYKRLFTEERLKRYREELHELPENDQLTREAVWFFQNMLLAERKDMDDIINAVQKIYDNRKQLL